MFRLVFLTFHGPRLRHGSGEAAEASTQTAPSAAPGDADAATGARGHDHSHEHGHGLHDAPPAMALALLLLALGSVAAGYVGVPHALGGHNSIDAYLAPSFQAIGAASGAEVVHDDAATELSLMGLSVLVAFAGIGVATIFFLRNTALADAWATRFAGVHRLLLNKYFVDEAYDRAIVQPIKRTSTGMLWRGVDAGLIDGTVNGVGLVVRGWSAVLRRTQTGSVRAYAMSVFLGVVVFVGYYLIQFQGR
jgi:NADH-quinone oxidoreductase subunit L